MSSPHTSEAALVAERMAALGRLAGGVAHDVNNILMVINGYAEILAESTDDEDSKDAVQAILDAATRAGVLTHRLLLFSRRQSIDAADVAVTPAIVALESTLRQLVPDSVLVDTRAGDSRLRARVDPGQLEQIVRALVVNARDAMPGGGRLTVSVEGTRRGAFVDASGEQAPAGDYVRLAVTDTGEPIDDAVRRRVFEPFFSARSARKGSGFDLATVYGIVKSSGGFVDVGSSAEGTTFEVYFPLVDASPAALGATASPSEGTSVGGSRDFQRMVAHDPEGVVQR